jgi:hypothetical protein
MNILLIASTINNLEKEFPGQAGDLAVNIL